MQQRRRGPSRNAFRCAFHVGSQLASESAPTSGFLTFSNVAVGNGREWAGADGSQSSEKPYRITRIGSGRDSPEPPRSGSNPAGATKFSLFYKGFHNIFGFRATNVQPRSPFFVTWGPTEVLGLVGVSSEYMAQEQEEQLIWCDYESTVQVYRLPKPPPFSGTVHPRVLGSADPLGR